jgi:two-component system LytT family response regulator
VTCRTLLVDDEPLARQRIRALLDADPEIELVGECGTGLEAVDAVRQFQPDLMFLDVQMPVMSGFEVLQALAGAIMPVVIFVTAHDRFALKAFEVHALDYLLKPFDRDRFRAALDRAKGQVRLGKAAGLESKLSNLLQTVQERRGGPDRLVVKSAGRIYFVRVQDIDWIEAAGNYLRLHAGTEEHLLRESMNALEARLDPARFARIHRSTMVNLERIRELQPAFHGDYLVVLQDGSELTLSRNYREKLQKVLGNAL